ncbi:hypothetical protein [Corynebacterium sp.]|uniref:hypothetical protein n=1 Tax=Corynebacterium sp. TaxID=1720 RepID=UPI002A914E20|nr:hypothetical protein [Corynebacterium sp.]MDY5785004.1 hypothetical protein [Corynebacterium sp.]
MLLASRTIRSAAATVAVAGLSFGLVACGSDEESSTGGLSTAASVPTVATSGEQSRAENTEEATSNPATHENEEATNNAEGDDAAVPTLVNPFENPEAVVPSHEPLQEGNPANDADREEMRRAVEASLNPGSYDRWTRVLLENSCRKVSDATMAELNRNGMTLEQVEQAARAQQQAGQAIELPRTEVSIDDVRVDGNRASASITAASANGTETNTQIFEREDGRWKLCN